MKKYLILILVVAVFACTKKQPGYKINVDLKGAEGAVILETRGGSEWVAVDTADIVNGVAVLEGEVEFPGDYYLSVLGQRPKALVFVENKEMSVVGNVDSLNTIKVSGSATHDEYEKVNQELNDISEKYMALYEESRTAIAAGDTAKGMELMDEVNKLYESTTTVQENFIKNNPSSYAAPFFLTRVQYGKEVEQLDSLVAILDPKLQSVPSIVELKAQIEKLKRVSIGQIAPDFTQNDVDGNPVKFSDIYAQNEITLLDFWAAWCGPCRQENPNVVAVFNEFKDKGFTVFGVSLDREKEAWVKAIADDRLTWTQVSDLAYWNNAVAQDYAIRSIPSSLLVDKSGKIIAKNKRGDELRETVANILGN